MKFPFKPMLLVVALVSQSLCAGEDLLQRLAERPLARGEVSDEELRQTLGWVFGIVPPIVEIDEQTKTIYRQLFEDLGAYRFAERQAAQKALIDKQPQPSLMSYWARKAEDLERRERGNDVIRAWEKRFPPLDILAKIPTGPFKLQAMNSLQRMDKDASKDFFREEIRLNGFSLNREQRLECLRLITPRIPGDEYGYGFTTRYLFTFDIRPEEASDPEWLLTVATILSEKGSAYDYRGIQLLEQAFRCAPSGLDLEAFKVLLTDQNPYRIQLAGVLARLGDEEAAKLFLEAIQEGTLFLEGGRWNRSGAYMVPRLPPRVFPNPKQAEAAYLKWMETQLAWSNDRYGGDYVVSEFIRQSYRDLRQIPGMDAVYQKIAIEKGHPLRYVAALFLRAQGPEYRDILRSIDPEQERYASYILPRDVVLSLLTELFEAKNNTAREQAEADLIHLLKLHARWLVKDLADWRAKGRRCPVSMKSRLDDFCGLYRDLVLPVGIHANLQEELLKFSSYEHAYRTSYSSTAMRVAVAEAMTNGSVDELIETVTSGTNILATIQLLTLTDPNPNRVKTLLKKNEKELLALSPLPQPLREAYQWADINGLYTHFEFDGIISGLCSLTREEPLPRSWLQSIAAPSQELIQFCRDSTSPIPSQTLPLDNTHVEAVLSLAKQGRAPDELIHNLTDQIPSWLADFEPTTRRNALCPAAYRVFNILRAEYPPDANLHRLALLGAVSNTSFTPTTNHPQAMAYGWILEARRKMLQGDPPAAVTAWEQLAPLLGSTQGDASQLRAWREEAWISRWMAGDNKENILQDFKEHARLNGPTETPEGQWGSVEFPAIGDQGSTFLEFLLSIGERGTVVDLAADCLERAEQPTSFQHGLLAWAAAEEGHYEQAKQHLGYVLRNARDAETLKSAVLMHRWLNQPKEGFDGLISAVNQPDAATRFDALAKLVPDLQDDELKAYACWRAAGCARKLEQDEDRLRLLNAAPPNTLYGRFAQAEAASRPLAECLTMIKTDTFSDRPLPATVRPDISRIGFTKKPDEASSLYQRVLFLDERGIPSVNGTMIRANTAEGLWQPHSESAIRYRAGLRRVIAMNPDASEVHAVEILPWTSLLK